MVEVEVEKPDSPELVCYAGGNRQVLGNLIRNAIEVMPRGGRLTLRIRCSTDWRTGSSGVRITIADTGHGMSPTTRRQIYEPLFTTKGALGTGLGLWITGGLIAKHGGSMHVRSTEAPARSGTAFTLILPDPGAGEV